MKLTIQKEISAAFTDISDEMHDYLVDTSVVELQVGDFLYIGYEKPIFNLYAEMKVVNATSATLTVEYNSTSGFASVSSLSEETKAFTRSGFITWSNSITNWEKSTVNSLERFWLRISTDTNLDLTTELNGLNVVFANDNDLVEEYRNINSLKNSVTDPTYIGTHQSVRKDIIQKLRNQGNVKQSSSTAFLKNINQWDLLNISEVRVAARYYAISKIFRNASDTTDGKYHQLSRSYKKMGDEAFQMYLLTLDINDDGILDANEPAIQYSRTIRV